MDIKRSGSRSSGKGPAEYFTGRVRTDPIIEAPDPARVRAVAVTFEPGARTAWHTHPLGQTLIVIAGYGWAQREGGPIEVIRQCQMLLCLLFRLLVFRLVAPPEERQLQVALRNRSSRDLAKDQLHGPQVAGRGRAQH